MDTWFAYVLGISELIFHMKLETYEEACATLVLSSVGVPQALASAKATECGSEAVEVSTSADAAAPALPAASTSSNSDGTEETRLATPCDPASPSNTESTEDSGSLCGTDHGATASQSATSRVSAKGQQREAGSVCSPTTGKASRPAASSQQCPSTSAASPAETVSALLDAMQLRKPLRSAPSVSHFLDDIQAEADLVFQELEEVYGLRPGDVSAMRAAAAAAVGQSQPASPCPSGTNHSSSSPSHRPHSRPFPSAPTQARSTAFGLPISEQHVLYGELTSIGVRQLQAISMASVSVSRECLSRSRSQNFGYGISPPCVSSGAAAGDSSSYSGVGGSHAGSARHTVSGPSLLTAGNVPRGAVVMGVDVGCGNGRLLFEWARLATAACRRRPEGSRRRSHADDSAPATPPSTHSSSMSGGTYAAAARRGNLLAATVAPLGVPASNIVWRGWVGVGLELVPSRMRVARRALVPHYLNLKPALLVPAGGATVRDGQREEPVPLLDPVAPEAIAVSNSCGSFSSPNSVPSTALARTTPASCAGSTASADMSRTLASRVPQPTARVLLYEGDALRPGVLSNATLCRFPLFTLPGDTLTLLRGGSLLAPTRAHHLVNGLGGELMGSLGSVGYYTSAVSAPMLGGAATCPYPVTNVVAAGAALNSAYLNDASTGVYGRKGPASFMEMSTCSVTSNASSMNSNRGGSSAKHNYYRLCRVENGPSLTGKEDPHLVVFCCGLGFDEPQVWKLCQRLEDMLLGRPASSTSPTRPTSLDGFPSSQNISEDESAASPVAGNGRSVSSDDNGEVLEEMARGFGQQLSTPTAAEHVVGGSGISVARDMSGYRHWESVTCVMLLRPMDVLAPTFPLFRYATRIYNTQEHPVAAEDTAVLLATGNRTDGTAARCVMRDPPISDLTQEANVAGTLQEGDAWTTTLETTWMNAAPAWVLRFRF